jgi:hypothetical protein
MTILSLREAAERTETSKIDIWRAIQAGRLLAQRTDEGDFAIDPVELLRVFEAQRPKKRPMEQDATASPEALERPETNATTETAATNDWAITLSAFGAYLKSHVEAPAGAPANNELRLNREERQAADLAERTAQPSEPAGDRANAGEAIAKYARLDEPAKPWWRRWRRLLGWIHTRRGRAARQRLRERL